jgi:putative flippase GtrA
MLGAKPALAAKMLAFAVVGAIGFLVDAGLLTLSSRSGMNVYAARCISFSAAVLVTWLLNRIFVFGGTAALGGRKSAEYGRYLCVQVVGAAINLATFAAVLTIYPRLAAVPVLPLAAGAALGLVFNFAGARRWVFVRTNEGVS